MAGGTVGYNWQINNIVLGIEADLDWANIKGSTVDACQQVCKTELKSFGTVRPRIGYAFDRFMPYVTGGIAFGKLSAGMRNYNGRPTGTTTWEGGWAYGAGLEVKLSENFSAKAEYLRTELHQNRYDLPNVSIFAEEKNVNVMRIGLNYKFNSLFGN